jgi:hypothetical protein
MMIAKDKSPCICGQSHREARRPTRSRMEMRGQCFSRVESMVLLKITA